MCFGIRDRSPSRGLGDVYKRQINISENLNEDFYSDVSGSLESLGNTNIAYSPKFIAGNMVAFAPVKNVNIALFSKFVGKQYLTNLNNKNAVLNDYFVNDFSFNWDFPMKTVFKEISLNVLCNNIFNRKHVSNGYDYYGTNYYFPQAGTNYLAGITLKF